MTRESQPHFQPPRPLNQGDIVGAIHSVLEQTYPLSHEVNAISELHLSLRETERRLLDLLGPHVSRKVRAPLTSLLEAGIPFRYYGEDYVAVLEQLAPDSRRNAIKRAQRTIDRKTGFGTIYRRNSTVIERRKGPTVDGQKLRLREEQQLASRISIIPYQVWSANQKLIQQQKRQKEATALREKLNTRFLKRVQTYDAVGALRDSQASHAKELANQFDWQKLCINPGVLSLLPDGVVLSIGFGVDTTVPVRTLAYPLLGLELLRRKPRARLELYTATQFSGLNHLFPEQAANSQRQLRDALLSFVQSYFPDVAQRVACIDTEPLSPAQQGLIDELATILLKDDKLREFAFERSGRESLRYLAAHSLFMRDPLPIDPELFIVPIPRDGQPVVMIGGRAEQIMRRARELIMKKFDIAPSLQLFTSVGSTPPYYRYDTEPVLGEAVTLDCLDTIPEVVRDVALLGATITQRFSNTPILYGNIMDGTLSHVDLFDNEALHLALLELSDFSQQKGVHP